ncbi:hypothetical protein [Paenibacillus sp. GP183]|nr:hypothetical protein [Paenibacillus sp. GP183]
MVRKSGGRNRRFLSGLRALLRSHVWAASVGGGFLIYRGEVDTIGFT